MSSPPTSIDTALTALFLDVDGTLLEIRDRPEEVVADTDLIRLLDALSRRLDGALSLVSGRSVAEIDRIFTPVLFPAAGAHGAEIRLHPQDEVAGSTSHLPGSVVAALEEFAQAHDGLLLEHKNGGVSLHYRMAAQLEAPCRELVEGLMTQIEQEGQSDSCDDESRAIRRSPTGVRRR